MFEYMQRVRITGNYTGFYGNVKGRVGEVVGHEKADSGAEFYFVDLGPTEPVIKFHESELETA